ncbi:hypothetical protein HK405_009891, partial [Cladochytrium tenue]
MDWLEKFNPVPNWSSKTLALSDGTILTARQNTALNVELCSAKAFLRSLKHDEVSWGILFNTSTEIKKTTAESDNSDRVAKERLDP